MLKIVEVAYNDMNVVNGIYCANCSNETLNLFFDEGTKKIIGCCSWCGYKEEDEKSIVDSNTICTECDGLIKVRDIREKVPCSCGEINARVVPTKAYKNFLVTK